MKKFFLSLLTFLFLTQTTLAHPLDISSSFLNFRGNNLEITTFFHSYEIEYLLNNSWITIKNIWDYYLWDEIIKDYLRKNISLNISWTTCEIKDINITKAEEYEILTKWVEVNYNFSCDKQIEKWSIKIDFFNDFELQTNRITLYDLNWTDTTPFDYKVLTPQIPAYNFDLNNKIPICVIDSDGDWLSDDDEKLYKTDPYKIDTDWDFFTDYEEVNAGWYPVDKNTSPGQDFRVSMPDYLKENAWNNIKTESDCEEQNQIFTDNNKDTWLLQTWFANTYFAQTIEKISKYFNWIDNYSFIYIFLIVVFLGFIHAAWPGHSKTLLVSYIIDKNKTFWDGMIFIIIFSVTHLIDIVLLFLIVRFFFSLTNASNYMLYIQRFSIILLMFFSLFLIYKSYKNIKKWKRKSVLDSWIKWNVFLWIVSGLVPCTFGWSIFLLLFSLWKFSMILPLIWALWLWIFLFLFLVLNLVYFIRKKAFEKVDIFSKYSQILSSSLVLIVSVYLALKLF